MVMKFGTDNFLAIYIPIWVDFGQFSNPDIVPAICFQPDLALLFIQNDKCYEIWYIVAVSAPKHNADGNINIVVAI